MRSTLFICFVTAIMASSCAAADLKEQIQNNAMPGWEEKPEPGHSPGKAAWKIEEGVLSCTGAGGGWWGTQKEYADVLLDFEFKLPPGGNSGVYLHAPRPGEKYRRPGTQPADWDAREAELHTTHPTYVGFEVQLLDDYAPVYKDIKSWQHCGSIYTIAPAKKEVLKKAGEWNHMRIRIRGDHIVVNLNGEKIVDANSKEHPEILARRKSGFVGFQNHSTPVYFRNIKLADLAAERDKKQP